MSRTSRASQSLRWQGLRGTRICRRTAGARSVVARRPDERGSVAVEVVLLVPVLVLVLCMLVAGWRVWSARTQVDDAASAAARAATLETSASQAQVRALSAAHTNLEALGVHCDPETTSVDTSGFGTPPGTPAEVSATITCGIALDDLILPGLPGHWQVHAVRTHPMDTFRERRP